MGELLFSFTRSNGMSRGGSPLTVPSNNSLQGSGTDKVLGRGRGSGVLEQVLRARVLMRLRAAAELSR